MDSLRQAKLDTISRFLQKYTEPISIYDGMFANDLAGRLLNQLEAIEIEQFEKQMVKDVESHVGESYPR